MLFNSYVFVLLFFPVVLAGYFGLNRLRLFTPAKIFLILASLFFYGYANPRYLAVIVCSVVLNFLAGRILLSGRKKAADVTFYAALAVNIGILFYFKYYDFFISNLNALLGVSLPLLHLTLPLGISFFTFQQLSYVIDCRRAQTPRYSFVDYALFVTYFPQLIAGPIVLHSEIIPQFADSSRKKPDAANLARGLWCFTLGLGKKVLLADAFGGFVNVAFSNIPKLGALHALAAMLAYTFQIYFDFSGYSDMAMGICKMMNLDIAVNFNSPYRALNIVDFWKRWHITLTRFFTNYVYIPLGGSREGIRKELRNVFIVFLLSGLWHGANWTFLLWGILHGLASILTRAINRRTDFLQGKTPWSRFLCWCATFLFINLTWVIFRADSLKDAAAFFGQFLRFRWDFLGHEYRVCFQTGLAKLLFLNIPKLGHYLMELTPVFYFLAAFAIVLKKKNTPQETREFVPTAGRCLLTVLIFLGCVLSFSGVTTFLYWNF